MDRIVAFRKQYALDVGFVVPKVRIRDVHTLEPNAYQICIFGVTVAAGELLSDRTLAIHRGGDARQGLRGVATRDPAYGLPAVWITDDERQHARDAGYTLVDPSHGRDHAPERGRAPATPRRCSRAPRPSGSSIACEPQQAEPARRADPAGAVARRDSEGAAEPAAREGVDPQPRGDPRGAGRCRPPEQGPRAVDRAGAPAARHRDLPGPRRPRRRARGADARPGGRAHARDQLPLRSTTRPRSCSSRASPSRCCRASRRRSRR